MNTQTVLVTGASRESAIFPANSYSHAARRYGRGSCTRDRFTSCPTKRYVTGQVIAVDSGVSLGGQL
jgi:hypothetical protein